MVKLLLYFLIETTVAIGKPEQQVRKTSHCGQQATDITCHDHSVIACLCHIHGYMGVILRAHSVRGESHIQRNANGEVATLRSFVSWSYSNACCCK